MFMPAAVADVTAANQSSMKQQLESAENPERYSELRRTQLFQDICRGKET